MGHRNLRGSLRNPSHRSNWRPVRMQLPREEEISWVIIGRPLRVVSIHQESVVERPVMLRFAVGHCRRRKIRCVPSQNDVQGRCINCIRLKKECSFYPVDQQPPVETRQKSGSRSSVGPKIPSASSSPAMQPGIPSDIHGQQPYPQLTMPSIQNMAPPMKPSGSDSYPADSKSKSLGHSQAQEPSRLTV